MNYLDIVSWKQQWQSNGLTQKRHNSVGFNFNICSPLLCIHAEKGTDYIMLRVCYANSKYVCRTHLLYLKSYACENNVNIFSIRPSPAMIINQYTLYQIIFNKILLFQMWTHLIPLFLTTHNPVGHWLSMMYYGILWCSALYLYDIAVCNLVFKSITGTVAD